MTSSRIPLVCLAANRWIAVACFFMAEIALKWHIIKETGSSLAIGGLALAVLVPQIFGSFLSGAVITKLGPIQTILLSRCTAIVLAGSYMVLLSQGGLSVPVLIVSTLIAGSILAVSVTADIVLVPGLARLARIPLPRANAWFVVVEISAMLVGFVGGSFLALHYELFGVSITITVCLLAGIPLIIFGLPKMRPLAPKKDASSNLAVDYARAVAALFKDRALMRISVGHVTAKALRDLQLQLFVPISLIFFSKSIEDMIVLALLTMASIMVGAVAFGWGVLGRRHETLSLVLACVSGLSLVGSGVSGAWLALFAQAVVMGISYGPTDPIIKTSLQERFGSREMALSVAAMTGFTRICGPVAVVFAMAALPLDNLPQAMTIVGVLAVLINLFFLVTGYHKAADR